VVFISHSSKDRSIADAICNQLESAGIPCWIAPRDIEVGSDWTKGVIQGMGRCRVFVLVFTDQANDSEHVGREVANAFSLGLAVIPFRLEAVNPRNSLAYFLETVQWFDATIRPWQKHLSSLTEHVRRLLSSDGISELTTPTTATTPGTKEKQWVVGSGLLAVAAVIGAAWLFFSVNRSIRPTASSADTQKTVSNASVVEIPTKSIAVLPFDSLSANRDDTYFAGPGL
jgi:TIR domain